MRFPLYTISMSGNPHSELIILSWRHHPSAAIERPFSVCCNPASDQHVATRRSCSGSDVQYLGSVSSALKRSNRQLAMMVTGPIAFTLAIAEDEQLANAVGTTEAMVTGSMIRTLSQTMSAFAVATGGKADMPFCTAHVCF